MRTYFIYHIKEEFADFFYGREYCFYNLFTDVEKQGAKKDILKQQIKYITNPLHYPMLEQYFRQAVQKDKIYHENDKFYTRVNQGETTELNIESNLLKVKASGSLGSETIFFDILRNFSGHLLAVDFENKRYGWIKPVKQRKIV